MYLALFGINSKITALLIIISVAFDVFLAKRLSTVTMGLLHISADLGYHHGLDGSQMRSAFKWHGLRTSRCCTRLTAWQTAFVAHVFSWP